MEFKDAVLGRRTIRGFVDEDVSKETIEELISLSLWAPSWGNTQPFEIVAAVGPILERFKKENREALMSGQPPCPDIAMPQTWPGLQKDRYRTVGRAVLDSLSIARDDQEGRLNYYGDMFALFDARALLLFTIDCEMLLEYAILDVGLFMQTFCLAAQDRGLGTCILAAAVNYPDLSRRLFGIPESKRILMGVGVGVPDQENPVNRFERTRASIGEILTWAG